MSPILKDLTIASTIPAIALPITLCIEIANTITVMVVTASVTYGSLASMITIIARIISKPPILMMLLAERARL